MTLTPDELRRLLDWYHYASTYGPSGHVDADLAAKIREYMFKKPHHKKEK